MTIHWQVKAVEEINAVAAFYQEKQPGVEIRFLEVLEDALRRISRRPQMYQTIEKDIRR
ncbi:MAG: hypothetical protein ABIU05_07420 [Nitrospirales bacterium]